MRDLLAGRARFGALLLTMALALVLTGCAGDDGKDGRDGEDGATGPQGPSGTAICMDCHTDDFDMENFLLPIQVEFAVSGHNLGETFVRRGASCVRCHSNEGFQMFLATGQTEDLASTSGVSCFTCHSPHSSLDFSLRHEMSTALDIGGTYNKGSSNICAVCHQSRVPSPAINSADPITSSRWGPHHGPQSNILTGQGAHVFAGASYRNSAHNNAIGNGCVTCHMAAPAPDGMAGGHNFGMDFEYHSAPYINPNGCANAACHGEDYDQEDATHDVEDLRAEIDADMATLKQALIDKGWLTSSDLINTASPPATGDERGAVFNYLMILEDRSGGTHNPRYVSDVLGATLAFVEGKDL